MTNLELEREVSRLWKMAQLNARYVVDPLGQLILQNPMLSVACIRKMSKLLGDLD